MRWSDICKVAQAHAALPAPRLPTRRKPRKRHFSEVLGLRKGRNDLFSQPQPLLDKARVTATDLGLVFGWAIICTDHGQPYYDTQGDHIPEDSMLKAAAEFMQSRRSMKVMHAGEHVGTVVFAWPVTQETAQAMGMRGDRTGLMVAVKPDSRRVLERFRNGQYTGFSIGGARLIDEEED